tara:strand:- start:33 stop:299 length:267 start_codon:yes stop_codon:yes gene_type:complete
MLETYKKYQTLDQDMKSHWQNFYKEFLHQLKRAPQSEQEFDDFVKISMLRMVAERPDMQWKDGAESPKIWIETEGAYFDGVNWTEEAL